MRGKRRIWVRVVVGLLVVVVVAATAGYWYLRPLLRTGTGYAAHNACALDVIAHRPMTEDLPPNPLVPYLRIGQDGGGYRASVLGVLAAQQAWAVDDFGCTLAPGRPSFGAATPITTAANPLAGQATPRLTPALEAALAGAFGDDLDQDARERLGTRGVVVVRDGRIVAERYAPGFTADTPQLGWSMAKSVTSLLTGVLVGERKLALSDDRLRPEWSDDRARITVEDLLRMRSGLAWDETYDLGTTITAMLYDQPDMASFVASQPLVHPVGSTQQYSSGSTNLLCGVLRDRTGQGADLPRAALLASLGVSSAVWEADALGTPVCSSYLWATPRDWATIGEFARADGVWNGRRLLPEGWMRQTTTVVTPPSAEDPNYAAGWWTNRTASGSVIDQRLPRDAYWASGHDGQRLYVVPSEKLVVVRLGFSPAADDIRTEQLVADVIKVLG